MTNEMRSHAGAEPPDVVYTIDDWYDGPRSGTADFRGAPHWYRSLYLDAEEWNADEDRFELTPLSPEALARDLERAAIFKRWDDARRSGEVSWDEDGDTFGALPGEMERYEELNAWLEAYLAARPPVRVVRGTFEPGLRVRWSASPPEPHAPRTAGGGPAPAPEARRPDAG